MDSLRAFTIHYVLRFYWVFIAFFFSQRLYSQHWRYDDGLRPYYSRFCSYRDFPHIALHYLWRYWYYQKWFITDRQWYSLYAWSNHRSRSTQYILTLVQGLLLPAHLDRNCLHCKDGGSSWLRHAGLLADHSYCSLWTGLNIPIHFSGFWKVCVRRLHFRWFQGLLVEWNGRLPLRFL